MKRRAVLVGGAASGLATLWHRRPHAQTTDAWAEQFRHARLANPFLEGFRGVYANQELAAQVPIAGRVPSRLRGTLYRNGPALHELAGLRNHHWFDGDGMVQAFRLTDTALHHVGRLVMTEKLAAEIAAGRRTRAAFGTAIRDAEPARGPDSQNVANTSVLPFADELLALWEGGSAYRLDGRLLQTHGVKSWRMDLTGLPFSAHPKLDSHGALWNFGLDTLNSRMVLYEISKAGQLTRVAIVSAPDMTMVHDFAVTAGHLIFLLPPMRFNRAKMAQGLCFLDCHEWHDGSPLRALVVRKSDFAIRRILELPPGFVFHFGNAWEDSAGMVRFDYVRASDPSVMTESFKDVMRGVITHAAPSHISLVALDLVTGRFEQTDVPGFVEFPRVDSRVVGERYRNLYIAASTGRRERRLGFDAVRRLDIVSGAVDEFIYGDEYMVEEHIFVPDRASDAEGVGWVIGTALEVNSTRTIVSVFDAQRLAGGPIAQAALPYALPLGFHGNFAPS